MNFITKMLLNFLESSDFMMLKRKKFIICRGNIDLQQNKINFKNN